MVIKPKTKEKINPKSISEENSNLLKFSAMFPPKTIGKLIKKLNFKANASSNFLKSKVETVNPERDRPGKTAKPCIKPSNKPSLLFNSPAFLYCPVFALICSPPVINNNKPIIKVIALVDKVNCSSNPEKTLNRIKPKKPLIKVAITRNLKIL